MSCAWVLIGVCHALAGPENPQVVHGSADFEQSGQHTTINVSHRAIIDYSAFDLAPRESVRFVQPSTQSRVLNRIVGGRPTTLAGTLAANGRVYFINPQGVYFARTARIDASRFYAIGGRLANADFLAGVDRFTHLTGPVLNEGAIDAGQVHLAGSTVGNRGDIRANSLLTMIAGDELVLTEHGSHLSVRVDGSNLTDGAAPTAGSTPPSADSEPAVENSGTLDAPGGTVVLGAGDLVSLAIRNRGLVRAEGGDVTLAATDGAVVNTGVVDVSVQTGQAGTVAVKGPAVANTGAIRADAEMGRAGRIEVLGDAQVRLPAGGRLSAAGGAGAADGGTIIVDAPHGHTVLAEGARIDASGGRLGGAGGFVELSGESLIYSGDVDLASTDGRHGTLLIDPFNLHFVAGPGSHDSLADDGVILFDEPDETTSISIGVDKLVNAPGHVRAEASRNLYIDSAVSFNPADQKEVTFTAREHVKFHAPVTGALRMTVTADADQDGLGRILINTDQPITTTSEQFYHGQTHLRTDADLTATVAHFFGAVLNDGGQASRSLRVTGGADFNGPVGGTVGADDGLRLGSVAVTGPVNFSGGVVRTVGTQTYSGNANLLDHTLLIGEQVTFQKEIEDARSPGDPANAARLTIDADALFESWVSTDPSGAGRLVGGLEVLGRSIFRLGFHNLERQRITTYGDQIYHQPVALDDDTFFKSFHGDIQFRSRLLPRPEAEAYDVDLIVYAMRGHILFGDDVGGRDMVFNGRVDEASASDNGYYYGDPAFNSITATAAPHLGKVITIHGRRINAREHIRLNPGPGDFDGDPIIDADATGADHPEWINLTRVPEIATIAHESDGGLMIQSADGNVTMGQNNKLTAATGQLYIFASYDGVVRLGDLNALDSIRVEGGQILLRTREPADLLSNRPGASPFMEPDVNLDIVTNGCIEMTMVPTLAHDHATVRIGAPGGADADGYATMTADNFVYYDQLRDYREFRLQTDHGPYTAGTILDLTPGALIPPPPNVADALSGPLPFADRMVREPLLGPLGRAEAETVGITTRDLTPAEHQDAMGGRRFYSDLMPAAAPSPEAELAVSLDRVRRGSTLGTLDQYRALFWVERIDPTTGQPRMEDRRDQIRAVFLEAHQAFRSIAEDQPDLTFRRFIGADERWQTARLWADRIQALLESVRRTGITELAYRQSAAAVLRPIAPPGMDLDALHHELTGRPLIEPPPASTPLPAASGA